METAALLLVLAAIGGVIVVRIIWSDASWSGEPRAAVERSPAARPAGDAATEPRRREFTAAALSAALAVEAEAGGRPSFVRKTLAIGRLLLVLLFVCALAGGTLVLIATTIARMLESRTG